MQMVIQNTQYLIIALCIISDLFVTSFLSHVLLTDKQTPVKTLQVKMTQTWWHDHDMKELSHKVKSCNGHQSSADFSRKGAGSVELFSCCLPEQTVWQAVELPVIWDVLNLMWRHCNKKTCVRIHEHRSYKRIQSVHLKANYQGK